MTDLQPPTEKQADVLRFMARHLAERQRYPSCAETAAALQVTPNAISDRLKLLERKGWVRRPGRWSGQGYELVGAQITVEILGEHWTAIQLPLAQSA